MRIVSHYGPRYSVHVVSMDSIIFWNTRGACRKGLLSNLKVVMKNMSPVMVILAETRCSRESRLQKLRILGFDTVRMIPSVGLSGGLVAA